MTAYDSYKKAKAAIDADDYACFIDALNAGAPIDIKAAGQWSCTLMLHASYKVRPAMVAELLKRGADRHSLDIDGDNAINALFTHPIAKKSTEDAVAVLTLLLDAGVNPYQENNAGISAFNRAGARENQWWDIMLNHTKPVVDPLQVVFNRTVAGKDIEEIYLFDTMERVTYVHAKGNTNIEAVTRENFSALNEKSLLRAAFDEHRARGGRVVASEVFNANFSIFSK